MNKHLLSTKPLSRSSAGSLMARTADFMAKNRTANKRNDSLAGKTVLNLFFEDSTRTRVSFELAAKRLGADVINMQASSSSLNKGETLLDTARTINAMGVDAVVIRHPDSGGAAMFATQFDGAVINAGDGTHEHPTQALLDAYALSDTLCKADDSLSLDTALEGKTIAICGDITHSRVARSNLYLLQTLGANVRFIAPPTLMPAGIENFGVSATTSLEDGINDADAVMMLRVQNERMAGSYLASTVDYSHRYCLTAERLKLAKPNVVVLHPGPINRGVEICNRVADDDTHSIILYQVEAGVAARQAVLEALVK